MAREPRKRTAIIMFSNAQKAASPIKKKTANDLLELS